MVTNYTIYEGPIPQFGFIILNILRQLLFFDKFYNPELEIYVS